MDGYSDFNALHSGNQNEEVQLCAFDVKRLTRGPLGLAPPIDRLQPAQPVAHELLRILIALPLIFDLQPFPLIGIQGLRFETPKHAIRGGSRHKQGAIWPTDTRCFALHLGIGLGLERVRRGTLRASRKGAEHRGK